MSDPSTEASQAAPCPAGPPPAPGEPVSLQQKLINTATSALQSFPPLSKICQHVCAFHCYAHDTTRQVHAHHFCSHLNEEMRQCIIYDSGEPGARLIGIEYMISRRLYEGLPQEERRFWHSHQYEVSSGQLAALGVPLAAANLDASKLVDTYGKTFHTWQVDLGHPLPYGPPQLMMSFTGDGQLDPALQQQRDEMHGISSEEIRNSRAGMLDGLAPPHADADHPWRTGQAWTTSMQLQDAQLAGSKEEAAAEAAKHGGAKLST
eukprot:GHRQ01003276.1.p1 GENE.GHRQ01003276.1~~GHRQ01003276.1.p1  ORF type:complete len:263 (+),score=96.94 GHRQ01003276.1:80-868(+)